MARSKNLGKRYNDFADKMTNRSLRRKEARLDRKNRRTQAKTSAYVAKTPSKVQRMNASANVYTKKRAAKNIKAAGHALAENTAGATTAASYSVTEDYLDEKKKKKSQVTPTTSVIYQGDYSNDELENMPGGDSSVFNRYQAR